MRELRRFLLALGYFTRLPIPRWVGWAPDELNRAARYFPLVGLLVGGFSALVAWLGAFLWPSPLVVLLAMLSSLIFTGAFHEDGLADSADGFGGGWERAQVMAIMKDSRIGSYAAITLWIALSIKFAALQSLAAAPGALLMALPVAHAASRTVALMLMAGMTYVREDDSARAKPVAQGLGRTEWLSGLALGCAPALTATALGGLSPIRFLALGLVCVACGLICWRYFQHRLGGYTGDALGAAQQLTELCVYLTLAAAPS